MYPLKFKPIYKQMLWGGKKFQSLYNREIPGTDTGESWDLCCHCNGMSVVSNGALAGKTLEELLAQCPDEIYGCGMQPKQFPLLVKLIDANDNLSVQVHPNDDNADRANGESGKTEAWYILAAEPGAKLIFGLTAGTTKEQFAELVKIGAVEQVLRQVPVKTGDIISVPAGIVHALTSGVVVAEVQQNSDTTYRIYDYNRVGADGKTRELHVDAALRVIDFGEQPDVDFSVRAIQTPFFSLEEIVINGERCDNTNGGYLIYIILAGGGKITWADGQAEEVNCGETILVPAAVGEITLQGNMKILRTN
ncbi:MAG: type I phosphomannose isomerase catalytic subunit [Negativicutes bacterium]|jgi:mannose-6-phosphate isomerase